MLFGNKVLIIDKYPSLFKMLGQMVFVNHTVVAMLLSRPLAAACVAYVEQ